MVSVDILLAGAKEHRERFGRPMVTLSYAQTLDGSIAACRGVPCSLSGAESLTLTHRLRTSHDALLVGIGTILADNPQLNVRLVAGKNPQPVVLDSRLRFPLDARLLTNRSTSPWIVTTTNNGKVKKQLLETAGARIFHMPAEENGWVDLDALLKELGSLGVSSLMVEGGARVITSFLRRRLVDRLVLTITPNLMGGLRAVESPLFSYRDNTVNLTPLPQIQNLGCEQMAADTVIWAKLAWD